MLIGGLPKETERLIEIQLLEQDANYYNRRVTAYRGQLGQSLDNFGVTSTMMIGYLKYLKKQARRKIVQLKRGKRHGK